MAAGKSNKILEKIVLRLWRTIISLIHFPAIALAYIIMNQYLPPETEDAAILLQIWSMGCADPSLPYAGNLFTEKHPICQSRSIPVRQMGCFSIVIFQAHLIRYKMRRTK